MYDLRTQLQQCFLGRFCLMGLGNVDCGDDGFGVRFVEALRDGGMGATNDEGLLVAGTTPERFIGRVTEGKFEHLIFLDAVQFGGAPGAVIFLNSEEMTSRFPQVSTHKISLGLLAKLVESGGKTKAWLLGVQPESLRPGADLSPSVRGTQELLGGLLQQARGGVLNLC
jgi:hydrogenase 3 maturation protease